MKRSIRVAVAACAGLAALAFAGSAMAAYSPRLVVTTVTNKPSKQTTLLLSHVQDINDDPTARDTIYAPLGYQANLSQPVGTTIGDVVASGVFRQGANTPFQANGTVTVDVWWHQPRGTAFIRYEVEHDDYTPETLAAACAITVRHAT